MSDFKLKFGFPKGSLEEATLDLFNRAGWRISVPSRSYIPSINDPELTGILFRAQEMSRYVEDGVVDAGIVGHDWVVENGSDVVEVCELLYSKATSNPVKWVLAVPEESGIDRPEQLADGIIATELLETTKRYFAERNIPVKKVEFSWGATEVKARLVNAIVDVTETGSSIRANKLKIIATLLTSTTRLIANKAAWANPEKRRKIEDIAMLLKGAIAAREKVGLKLNAPRAQLKEILGALQGRLEEGQSPTINNLADEDWVAVEVIVDSTVERAILPALRRAGARAIISYPLGKMIS